MAEISYNDKLKIYTKWFVTIFLILFALFVLFTTLSLVQDKNYSKETAMLGFVINVVSALFSSKVWYEYVKDSKKAEKKQDELKEDWLIKYNNNQIMMDTYNNMSWFNHKQSRKKIGLLQGFAIVVNVGFALFNLWRLFEGI